MAAYSAIQNNNFGKVFQIHFTQGVSIQLPKDHRDWEMVKRKRIGRHDVKSINFMFQESYGSSAVQPRSPGQINRPFPGGQNPDLNEYSAIPKEIEVTLEIPGNVWERAEANPTEVYMQPIKMEMESKRRASQRYMCATLYGDGTGIVAQLSDGADDTDIATGKVVVELAESDRSFVGWVQKGELLYAYSSTGSARNASTVTTNTYKVLGRNRAANTVTLAPINESTGAITTSATASNLVTGDVLYRNEEDILNLSSITGDYNTITSTMAGLGSLTQDDERIVHGITMDSELGGSRHSVGGGLSPNEFNFALDKAKLASGEGAFKYDQMLMSPEVHSFLINEKEEFRRFFEAVDDKRGGKQFAFLHRNDTVRAQVSEFCPKNRIYMLPVASDNEKASAIELYGSDFKPINKEPVLKATSSGYANVKQQFLGSTAVLIAKQPNAIAVLEGFTLS